MNAENKTYRCLMCGKIFTKFGRQAEVLTEIQKLLAEYRRIINDPDFEKIKYTSLEMVKSEAECCDRPLILFASIKNGELK